MELHRDLKLEGGSISIASTASSRHRLWITPIINHHKDISYGFGSSALVMAPLTSKGTRRDAIGAIGTALVIIGRYASCSISGGLSLLYCCWYRLLDILLLLLVLMDRLLDRTQKRIGLIGRVGRMNTQLRHHGSDGCPTLISLSSQ